MIAEVNYNLQQTHLNYRRNSYQNKWTQNLMDGDFVLHMVEIFGLCQIIVRVPFQREQIIFNFIMARRF